MSDASLLLGDKTPPLEWCHDGKRYLIATCDLGEELLFTIEHESWAINRLEARRAKIGEDAYNRAAYRLDEALNANRFAFNTLSSMLFIDTPAGLARYVRLLALKGAKDGKDAAKPVKAEELELIAHDDPQAWLKLKRLVFKRDFPSWTKEEDPSSEDGATPAPSTSEFTSS